MKNILFLMLILTYALLGGMLFYDLFYLFFHILHAWIMKKSTRIIDKNPKWIMKPIQEQYYGFSDIDIFIVDSYFGNLPRFHKVKKTQRYELFIPDEFTTNDVDSIARMALACKIKLRCGIFFGDKPIQWLSILCYMLDGKNIEIGATKWIEVEKRQETN